MNQIPKLSNLAQLKIDSAGPRDRNIDIKVTIPTAKMIVEAENNLSTAANNALKLLEVANLFGQSLYASPVTEALRSALESFGVRRG